MERNRRGAKLIVRVLAWCLVVASLFVSFQTRSHALSGAAHAVAGAALGRIAHSEQAAFWAGFASHALLDAVPHAEWHLAVQTALFLGAAYAVNAEFERTGDRRLLWGAVGGALPDLEHLFYRLGWTDRAFYPSHNGLIPHGSADSWTGFWIEAGVLGLMIGIAY